MIQPALSPPALSVPAAGGLPPRFRREGRDFFAALYFCALVSSITLMIPRLRITRFQIEPFADDEWKKIIEKASARPALTMTKTEIVNHTLSRPDEINIHLSTLEHSDSPFANVQIAKWTLDKHGHVFREVAPFVAAIALGVLVAFAAVVASDLKTRLINWHTFSLLGTLALVALGAIQAAVFPSAFPRQRVQAYLRGLRSDIRNPL